MNKQELLENYTIERLADMVVEKYNREKSEENPYGVHYDLEDGKAIRFIGFEREEAELLFALICERITEKPMSLYPSDKLLQEVDEIKSLKDQLQRKKTAINQIDDILRDLFGVTFVICETQEDFDGFRRCLKKNIKAATVADFLPKEPIKVAEMLINTVGEYKHSPIVKKICGSDKGIYNLFGISELRQIAKHLLIYCNANREGEE